MKVTIHEFKGSESKRTQLEELFAKYLYPGVKVTAEEFPPAYGRAEQGWRYVKLLQAATPPEQGITLSVDASSFGGYRAYIRAYFALTGRYLSYADTLPNNFFPAVSVQDRMVLVPHGLKGQLAQGTNEMSPFPAFKEGGVLEVDFGDQNAVRNAVRLVSERLHADFLKDLQAYGRFQDLNNLPLQVLADDLNTDLGYIQHLLKGDQHVFDRASYNYFEWSITPEELPVNRWTKVTLTLKNNSDQELERLSVQLRGPVKVSPERIEMTVAARSSADTLVAVKPEESGDYPLEIVGVLPQDKPLAALVNARPIWVKFI
ncbi:MAG TPA: hypothetical protein VJT15_07225 [Pyrinomonadaceae bacterium]|nr:hypothetical protein [Pyrinomonadaceae bacterium]